jgi:cytochrome c biogenesis protein CcmG/thiol:disulfide interchange protein DsbE
MTQKTSRQKEERQAVRAERKEFEAELAENFANLPRRTHNRQRTITFIVLAIIALLMGIFGWLVLLPSSTETPGPGVAVGTAAPEFVLPIYGGTGNPGSVDLLALRGHPVIINFWSESCAPCRAEMPYLQRIYIQYATQGEFTLAGINQADPKDDIARFGASFKISYPLLFDKGGTTNIAYGVTAIPTTYFVDSKGIVRSVFVTQLSPQTMKQGLASVGIIIT